MVKSADAVAGFDPMKVQSKAISKEAQSTRAILMELSTGCDLPLLSKRPNIQEMKKRCTDLEPLLKG